MKLTYDPTHNIAYLRLREPTTEIETVQVTDELNIDLTPNGTVYGIELLNANEQLLASGQTLVVENPGTGERIEVVLPSVAD